MNLLYNLFILEKKSLKDPFKNMCEGTSIELDNLFSIINYFFLLDFTAVEGSVAFIAKVSF